MKNNDLIEILRRFNRKERFFLVGYVLGNEGFVLGNEFRKKLERKLEIAIPTNAFAAMDYHLDWIEVSLRLWNRDIEIRNPFKDKEKRINKNQEDIDFIIAFEKTGKYHIVLIEAKAETGWTNKQMLSKSVRFDRMFGKDGKKYKNVELHFLLMSPRMSKLLLCKEWPTWMTTEKKPNWMELPVPNELMKVTRCDINGNPKRDDIYRKVDFR